MTVTCAAPRPLWLGPGRPPVATCCPAHFWAPLDPHAPPARCCSITAPHRHRTEATR